jgi:hypothetical protein
MRVHVELAALVLALGMVVSTVVLGVSLSNHRGSARGDRKALTGKLRALKSWVRQFQGYGVGVPMQAINQVSFPVRLASLY